MKIKNYKLKIVAVGAATFFFGFGAGAILNFYLIQIHSPMVTQLRGSLTFISSIVGDGILLPIVNMIVVSFLLKNKTFISKFLVLSSLFMGLVITAYFHITQAVNGLTNWAMPTPWHWNFLGVWHGIYMFSVCWLLSLFLLTVIVSVKRNKFIPREAFAVSVGVIVFLVLLRLDYLNVSIGSLI